MIVIELNERSDKDSTDNTGTLLAGDLVVFGIYWYVGSSCTVSGL